MNRSLIEIAFIVDRSGSVSAVQEQAITGFNDFLADQTEVAGDARLTSVLFDDEYRAAVSAVPLPHASTLDATPYVPRNTMALLDAIGPTIDELGQRLAATPESDRPDQVAILTDGLENASARYAWEDDAARIRHQCEKYNWPFLFFAANQDAIATATHIATGNTPHQRHLACGEQGRTAGDAICHGGVSQRISIPTGLGKTAAFMLRHSAT